MKRVHVAMIGIVAVLGVSGAFAQEQEQQKLLARRAAIADAYRKLAECVYGLQINSETYVKDFVTESDVIQSAVDTMIRGVRLGKASYWEDGSCEIPAEVTVASVITTLKEAHSRHYKGNKIKASDFVSMQQHIEKKVIKVVGMGAPRPDLPPELPEGVVELLPEVTVKENVRYLPPIWRKCGPQARLMAIRAAELDAKRRLAERVKGLRLTSDTLVRDFVTESDTIEAEMNAFLRGAEIVSTYLHDDELIAEVTVRLPMKKVISHIKELHTRHYKHGRVKGSDITKIEQSIVKKDFEETGMGVPPARYMQKVEVQYVSVRPAWISTKVTATGEATDPDITSAQGKLKAKRAAELVAKRNLAEQIAGLEIVSGTLVRDFVTEYDEIQTEVDAVLVNCYIKDVQFTGDTAIVTVEIPAVDVWNVIYAEWRRVKHQ